MKLMSVQMANPPADLNELKVRISYEEEEKQRTTWTKEGAEAATVKAKATWFSRLGSMAGKRKRKR